MRISDWSSDVCSSDLERGAPAGPASRAGRQDRHPAPRRAAGSNGPDQGPHPPGAARSLSPQAPRSGAGSPAWRPAAVTVLASSTALVIGPTPPGPGVLAPDTAAPSAKTTPPTSRDSPAPGDPGGAATQ